jgi:polyhydroxybutyrate depolymerase
MRRRALTLTLEVSVLALLAACSEAATSPTPEAASGNAGVSPVSTAGVGVAGTSPSLAGSSAGGVASAGGSAAAGNGGNGGSAGLGAAGSSDAGSAGAAGAGRGGGAGEDLDAPKPSEGCNSAAAPAEGKHELTVGALERSYVLRKAKGYSASAKKPWPIVLALHPNGSASDYWDATTGPRALRPLFADEALLVMPQAQMDDWRTDLATDVAYFDALLEELKTTLCLDERRIFAMGHSGGGSFSGVLGCERTDIRAIAASGAVIYFDREKCVGKPAAWITIGEDEAIPERIEYRDFFRTYAACTTTSTPVSPSPCVAYECPDARRAVTFCSHAGGHEWPSFGSQATFDFFSRF